VIGHLIADMSTGSAPAGNLSVLGLTDFLTAPWEHRFMVRALWVMVISGAVCGVIGSYVVLRGMAFIGDAVSHAVFPGVAIAFVIKANMVIGGAVAGLLTAVGIALFSQNRRLREDTVIGVFFAASFGLGIVVLSLSEGYAGSLESFLFGQILGISDGDVRLAQIAGPLLVGAAVLLHKELVTVCLDRETAHVAGLPVSWLDLALYSMVTTAIVVALQAVGNILVLALLVTPAACARLLTDRLAAMMVLAATIGAGSSVVGLYISYHNNIAAGGTIVMVLTALFLLSWLLAPRHGLVPRALSHRSLARSTGSETPAPEVVPT
jgi:manganese/iron transport system permease protein